MRGEIVALDATTGEGEIAADDLARYRFSIADASSPGSLRTGARVEFAVADGKQAREVVLLGGQPPLQGAAGSFDFGRVIQRAFTSIGQNWLVFFGSAALLTGVPSALAAWGQMTMIESPNFLPGMAWFIGAILNLIGSYLLQAMVLRAAINGFNGKSTSFEAAFEVAVRMALPLFGLAILVGLGMIVGFILFVIPAIFLAIIWCVAAPVPGGGAARRHRKPAAKHRPHQGPPVVRFRLARSLYRHVVADSVGRGRERAGGYKRRRDAADDGHHHQSRW